MVKRKFQSEFAEYDLKTPAMCRLSGLKKPAVFSMEKICKRLRKRHKRCDEVVFCDLKKSATGIYCVENKGGAPENVKLSHVQEQLQGGANVVASRLSAAEKFFFLPVLATPTGMLSTWRLPLLNLPVEMRGERKIISVAKKNDNLSSL